MVIENPGTALEKYWNLFKRLQFVGYRIGHLEFLRLPVTSNK